MTTRLQAPPRPPAQLWGLWASDDDRPDGFWYGHIHGRRDRHEPAPMTFISRDDALAAVALEREANGDVTLNVALIGVAPPN